MKNPSCPECGMTNPYGIDIQGLYDGVLIWECPACNHMWPRFPTGARHERALKIIEDWKKARA